MKKILLPMTLLGVSAFMIPTVFAQTFCDVCTTEPLVLCEVCQENTRCEVCAECFNPDCNQSEYQTGTKVSFDAEADHNNDGLPDHVEYFYVEVPARMHLGEERTVRVYGEWPSNRIVRVMAEPAVFLTNTKRDVDTIVSRVAFDSIAATGSNTHPVDVSKFISLMSPENETLLGRWEGVFNYYIEFAALNHSLQDIVTIPDGAYYANAETLYIYDEMPDEVQNGDIFLYGDYLYLYNGQWVCSLATEELSYDGYHIKDFFPDFVCTDKDQLTYSDPVRSINGEPVVSLAGTYANCYNMVYAPSIPDTVEYISEAYINCYRLTSTPEFPTGLRGMSSAFMNCNQLLNVKPIPAKVSDLRYAFAYCDSIMFDIKFDNPNEYSNYNYTGCFEGVDFYLQNISLQGTINALDDIGSTGKNYCIDCNGFCYGQHEGG